MEAGLHAYWPQRDLLKFFILYHMQQLISSLLLHPAVVLGSFALAGRHERYFCRSRAAMNISACLRLDGYGRGSINGHLTGKDCAFGFAFPGKVPSRNLLAAGAHPQPLRVMDKVIAAMGDGALKAREGCTIFLYRQHEQPRENTLDSRGRAAG